MARIAGVDLPPNKRVEIGLTYIFGIGRPSLEQDPRDREGGPQHAGQGPLRGRGVADPQDDPGRSDRSRATSARRRPRTSSVSWRSAATAGCGTAANLPVRGQRTHTNARTRKGPRQGRRGREEEGDEEVGIKRKQHGKPDRKSATASDARKASAAKGKKKGPKKEKKNIPHALATVQASFNNTIVSITDQQGNVLAWSSAGRIGFKGSRKGTPFAAQLAAGNAAQIAQEHGVRSLDVKVNGPRRRPRERDPRPRRRGHRHPVHQGRDAHPAQRLPAAQAAAGLEVLIRLV